MTLLEEMRQELSQAKEIVKPNIFWSEINQSHENMLDLENFKIKLATRYFTFFPGKKDDQFRYVCKEIPKWIKLKARILRYCLPPYPELDKKRSKNYREFTTLLWEYLRSQLPESWLKVPEPKVGNPLLVRWRGREVTQDLGNSLLEIDSIISHIDVKQIKTVLELGGGYGRTTYAYLALFPNTRYICADIPPALFVAQSYLQKIFPKKRIFTFRPFAKYEEIQQEFEAADICFLLPHQLEFLPEKCIDLGINISSLHEMRLDQIAYYFDQFSRLVNKFFYHKQWKTHCNYPDRVIVMEEDYPIPAHWKQVMRRDCRVQTLFFEATYNTSDDALSHK